MSAPSTPADIGSPIGGPAKDNHHTTWLYAPDQYERGTLARLVAAAFAANRHVDYADNWSRAESRTIYRTVTDADGRIDLRVHGHAVMRINGGSPSQWAGTLTAQLTAGDGIEIVVEAPDGEPAALGIESSTHLQWAASPDGIAWHPAGVRPGGYHPPHALGEEVTVIQLADLGTHYEATGPTLGRIVIESSTKPVVSSGESLDEAMNPQYAETRHSVTRQSGNRWITDHELGFRYVVVSGTSATSVCVEARARPTIAPGAFACSDADLTRIWNVGATTLHACMQKLVLDGIKRDRLPWLGDHSLNLLSNAFSVGDAVISRDSLVALGTVTHGYVNGIADYSLWWLITSRFQQLHFGDDEYVETHADRIHSFAAQLSEQTSDRGYFDPHGQADGFPGAGHGSIFIDWGMTNPDRDTTALQMLWYWALRSTAEMLRSVRHPEAERWAEQSDRVRDALISDAWDGGSQRWRDRVGGADGHESSYPNFLAVLSGVDAHRATPQMAAAIRQGAIGTPFMRALALRALALLGDRQGAVDEIRSRWGAFLGDGVNSFPEEFLKPGESPHEMYGRPFGKSLCHAWASGPVSLLPQILLGLEPRANGWTSFTVNPALGDLEWAAARIRTMYGDIAVIADRQQTRVWVPEGTEVVLGDRTVSGPAIVDSRHATQIITSTTPLARTA